MATPPLYPYIINYINYKCLTYNRIPQPISLITIYTLKPPNLFLARSSIFHPQIYLLYLFARFSKFILHVRLTFLPNSFLLTYTNSNWIIYLIIKLKVHLFSWGKWNEPLGHFLYFVCFLYFKLFYSCPKSYF